MSRADHMPILIQFVGGVMYPFILIALMFGLPVMSVSIQTELGCYMLAGHTS
jgi:hypothetical protein